MRILTAAFLVLLTGAAHAQSPDCSLSPPGWETNTPLVAVSDPAALDGATGNAQRLPARPLNEAQLILGKASHVTLHSALKVRYVTPPERKPDPALHGGLVVVTIPATGNYRVGLSSGAWIDVLQDGKPVTSTAHGHGEGCVRKAVTFPLEAGRIVIQISGNREPDLRLMVWRQN